MYLMIFILFRKDDSMYYQFDSRLSMPAILFDDDRVVVAGIFASLSATIAD